MQEVAPVQARLVNNAEFFSASSKGDVSKARRDRRYELLRNLWTFTAQDRLAGCCRFPIDGRAPVELKRNGDGVCYTTNVQRCGYSFCPVCGPKLAQARADEIERGCLNHLATGGGLESFMLTVPHRVGMRLDRLLDVVGKGFARVVGGRRWKADKERFGVLGQIKSLETTLGLNGWHPHLHVLVVTHRPLTDEERDVIQSGIYHRWAGLVEREGLPLPARELCRMEPVRDAEGLSDYLVKIAVVADDTGRMRKVGLELARHDLKEGRRENRTPFQILSDFINTGDADDYAAWMEYEGGIKGKCLLRWSNGLKALLGVTEVTDEDIMAEEEGGAVLLEIDLEDWKRVCGEGSIARLYRLAESDPTLDAVRAYLDGLRLPHFRAGPT